MIVVFKEKKKIIVIEIRLRSVYDIYMSFIYIYFFVKSVVVIIMFMLKVGLIFLYVIFFVIKDIW